MPVFVLPIPVGPATTTTVFNMLLRIANDRLKIIIGGLTHIRKFIRKVIGELIAQVIGIQIVVHKILFRLKIKSFLCKLWRRCTLQTNHPGRIQFAFGDVRQLHKQDPLGKKIEGIQEACFGAVNKSSNFTASITAPSPPSDISKRSEER